MAAKVAFNLKKYQKKFLTMAQELCYNEITMEKIKNAKTQYDLDRAMRYGRLYGGSKNVCTH